MDFEFEIVEVRPHPAFRVEPTRGVVRGNGSVTVETSFCPLSLTTEEAVIEVRRAGGGAGATGSCLGGSFTLPSTTAVRAQGTNVPCRIHGARELGATSSRTWSHAFCVVWPAPQVRIAEFNSKPVTCVLTGSGWPGAARDRALAAALGDAAEGLQATLPGVAGRGTGRAGKEPKAGASPVLSMEELDGTAVRAEGRGGWWSGGQEGVGGLQHVNYQAAFWLWQYSWGNMCSLRSLPALR